MKRYRSGRWINGGNHFASDGNVLFVREGLGGKFKAFVKPEAEPSDTLKAHAARFKGLEWRNTAEEAQADLDALAAKKRWWEVENA